MYTVNAWQVNSLILFMYWIDYDVRKRNESLNLIVCSRIRCVCRLIHSWDSRWGYSFVYSDFDPISKRIVFGCRERGVMLWRFGEILLLDTTNRAKICVSLKPFYTFSVFACHIHRSGLNGFLKYLHIKMLEFKIGRSVIFIIRFHRTWLMLRFCPGFVYILILGCIQNLHIKFMRATSLL